MGVSLAVAMQKKLHRAVPRRTLVVQVIRRSLVLVFLGIVVNSSKHSLTIAELRLPGVLQRFGVTYLIVGLLEVAFTKRLELEVGRVTFNNQFLTVCLVEFKLRQ